MPSWYVAFHCRKNSLFRNGIRYGAYKLDLGKIQSVTAITSWSFNKNGNRGAQRITIYGSKYATDPGWDLADRSRFMPLGGIDTNDLSSKTMMSNKVDGLYFIGEVVDVTGWLGGYNFQWAWSSGWVAGQVV